MPGATGDFLRPRMAVRGAGLRFCERLISWATERRPDCFALSLSYCKEHGDIRGLSYLRPFWLEDEIISFISA